MKKPFFIVKKIKEKENDMQKTLLRQSNPASRLLLARLRALRLEKTVNRNTNTRTSRRA